jgi:hypothetical protein
MGGTGRGACGPGGLAAKAACATTMRAGMMSLRASFFMWISAESGNIFYVEKYVLHWFIRKYTLRCISPDAKITAENPLYETTRLALAIVVDFVASAPWRFGLMVVMAKIRRMR